MPLLWQGLLDAKTVFVDLGASWFASDSFARSRLVIILRACLDGRTAGSSVWFVIRLAYSFRAGRLLRSLLSL